MTCARLTLPAPPEERFAPIAPPSRAPLRVLLAIAAALSASACSAPDSARGPSPEAAARIAPDPERSNGTSAPRAATDPPPDDPLAERAALLCDLALQGEAYAMLRELTTIAPARLSGSDAAERAVEWGVSTMRRIGLEGVRREPVLVPVWKRGAPESLHRVGPDGSELESFAVLALGGSIATPGDGITAEVMMVRGFEELRARAGEARGKIVFFNRPMPRALVNTFLAYRDAVPQRSSGPIEAARAGGVFALVRSMTTRLDDLPHTGATGYDDGVPRVPAAAISTRGAEALAARIEAGERVVLRARLHCSTEPDRESANVVGELRGSERPDEIVLIGGHLDSWDVGAGAHDDGAGCVHALEALRLLREARIEPRRTIRAVLFMNEENGLRGGREYARAHAGELARHVAAIESDSGGFLPRGFSCSATGARGAAIAAIVDRLDRFDMGAAIPGGGGADIQPLAPAGVTLMSMVTVAHRYFDFHHSAADTLDAVHERELALGAAALAFVASAIADADLP